ncbi:MAG TPA: cytochrome c [Thermoanaerobaculia bacterium]|nr:cytochrome c [Thermoanaerobaculia bacterium]
MKPLLVVLAALAAALAAVAAAVSLGLFEVAATEPHWRPVEWLLATARDRAVAARAGDLAVPPLDHPRLLRRGIALYDRHCVPCHGAPGVDPSPWAWGLNPFPPPLHDAPTPEDPTGHAARTYWVVANGIRMSGMPAFGVALSEEETWAVTAVVERLRELSAEDYAAMVRAGEPER